MKRPVKFSHSKEDLTKIIDLRYEILRKPWDQPYSTSSDELEEKSINAFITDDTGRAIACGRLQENEDRIGQVRYMAVHTDFQGQGLGHEIIVALENKARLMGMVKIELHARENALDFYQKEGYKITEVSYKLWNIIQHYLMEKTL
jgi:N-acetylglutamate synthase-like GNAT family acetyltransferase